MFKGNKRKTITLTGKPKFPGHSHSKHITDFEQNYFTSNILTESPILLPQFHKMFYHQVEKNTGPNL